MWNTNKSVRDKTFTVRQDVDRYGMARWQVAQDVIGDASFYNREFAASMMERFLRRHKGFTPVFVDGATDPRCPSINIHRIQN